MLSQLKILFSFFLAALPPGLAGNRPALLEREMHQFQTTKKTLFFNKKSLSQQSRRKLNHFQTFPFLYFLQIYNFHQTFNIKQIGSIPPNDKEDTFNFNTIHIRTFTSMINRYFNIDLVVILCQIYADVMTLSIHKQIVRTFLSVKICITIND